MPRLLQLLESIESNNIETFFRDEVLDQSCLALESNLIDIQYIFFLLCNENGIIVLPETVESRKYTLQPILCMLALGVTRMGLIAKYLRSLGKTVKDTYAGT